MAKRLRIGITYNYSEDWIGGTYYIDNLVNALNFLKEEEQPIIVVITRPEWFKILKAKTNYPFLAYQVNTGETNFLKKAVNTLLYRTIEKRLFSRQIPNLDGIFPFNECEHFKLAKLKAFWIADFQEHFLPHFFSPQEIKSRKECQNIIAYSNEILVLSSEDSSNHFKNLYPDHIVKTYILPFSISHKDVEPISKDLLDKYNIPSKFFICSNQLWQHKNHIIILKALKYLNENHHWQIPIVFTGKVGDHRNPLYYDNLLQFTNANNLANLVYFLGFVPRNEQLTLMNHSVSILQPSLFEGWSTVVEDAKALDKMIIASNLEVHKEQLNQSNALFFDPSNEIDLAEKILIASIAKETRLFIEGTAQEKYLYKFAKSFISIFKNDDIV